MVVKYLRGAQVGEVVPFETPQPRGPNPAVAQFMELTGQADPFYVYGPQQVPADDTPPKSLTPEEIQAILMQAFLESLGDGDATAGPSAAILPYQAVMPPTLELLAEMRERRAGRRTAGMERFATLVAAARGELPSTQKYYPGFEPGGVADAMLSLITGKGIDEIQRTILPMGQREVERRAIPEPAEIPEPTVAEEFPEAEELARLLTEAIKMIAAGQVVAV